MEPTLADFDSLSVRASALREQLRTVVVGQQEVIEQLLTTIRATLAEERTPLIHAYALGKSQEVAAILAQANIPVVQHPAIAAVSDRVIAHLSANGLMFADTGPYRSTANRLHELVLSAHPFEATAE